MNDLLDITKALADGSRLRILMALRAGELCVCQLIELLVLAPSTVSKHMSILRQAHLVQARKDGRWMYYRLADRGAAKSVREALAWLQRNLTDKPEIARDNKKLQKILRIDREVLCKKQNRS
jgi:DNA-binding transcriptional ArsR family regulator